MAMQTRNTHKGATHTAKGIILFPSPPTFTWGFGGNLRPIFSLFLNVHLPVFFFFFLPLSAPLSVLHVFFCSAAWFICGVRWRDFSRGFFWFGIFLFLFEFQLVFPPLQTEACAGDSYSTTMQLYRKEYIKGHISKSNFLWLLCSRLVFISTLQAQVSHGFQLNVSCDLCCWFKKGSYILKHLISHKGASRNADLFLQVAR